MLSNNNNLQQQTPPMVRVPSYRPCSTDSAKMFSSRIHHLALSAAAQKADLPLSSQPLTPTSMLLRRTKSEFRLNTSDPSHIQPQEEEGGEIVCPAPVKKALIPARPIPSRHRRSISLFESYGSPSQSLETPESLNAYRMVQGYITPATSPQRDQSFPIHTTSNGLKRDRSEEDIILCSSFSDSLMDELTDIEEEEETDDAVKELSEIFGMGEFVPSQVGCFDDPRDMFRRERRLSRCGVMI